jgi:hypothetical protein
MTSLQSPKSFQKAYRTDYHVYVCNFYNRIQDFGGET